MGIGSWGFVAWRGIPPGLSRRVGAGSTGRLVVLPGRRDGRAGQGSGRARMRVKALAMSCAQGHDGGIFRLPPSLAFDDPPGGMEDLVAQCFRLGFGQVAVQGEEPQPGQQVTSDRRGLAPGGIDVVGRIC